MAIRDIAAKTAAVSDKWKQFVFLIAGKFSRFVLNLSSNWFPSMWDVTFFVKIQLGSDQDRGILQPDDLFLSDLAIPRRRKSREHSEYELLAWRIGFHRALKGDSSFLPGKTPCWRASDYQGAYVRLK